MPITLALFDMAATTVDDTIDGRPLVLQSFEDSLNAVHVTVPWEVLNAQRGKDKMEVFRTLLASHGGFQGEALEQTAQRLLEHFTAQLLRNVERLREMPGAAALGSRAAGLAGDPRVCGPPAGGLAGYMKALNQTTRDSYMRISVHRWVACAMRTKRGGARQSCA